MTSTFIFIPMQFTCDMQHATNKWYYGYGGTQKVTEACICAVCEETQYSETFVTNSRVLAPVHRTTGPMISDITVTLFPAYSELGYYEQPPTTNSFLCIYLIVIGRTQCMLNTFGRDRVVYFDVYTQI